MADQQNQKPAAQDRYAQEAQQQQGQDAEFSTEFNAAAEQNTKPEGTKARPDKKDDRGNHR
jgi:hypothetical protein